MYLKYKNIYDSLNARGIYHFGSYISGSQYFKAYELVIKYVKDNSKVLDWGAGSGHFSYFLLQNRHNVTAFSIESKIALLDYLNTNFPGKYNTDLSQDPLTKLPYYDQYFDAVVSIGVLEHVRDTGNIEYNSLSEIQRILKPDGVFICYHFPNKLSWIESITKHLDSKYNHTFKYNLDDIKKLTNESNLKLLEYNRYGILPRNTFRKFTNSIFLTKLFNSIDISLSKLFNLFCQNYYFVAKRIE
jgi:ubiquinone/menaquinone biosynthesis C-methylase UbiE